MQPANISLWGWVNTHSRWFSKWTVRVNIHKNGLLRLKSAAAMVFSSMAFWVNGASVGVGKNKTFEHYLWTLLTPQKRTGIRGPGAMDHECSIFVNSRYGAHIYMPSYFVVWFLVLSLGTSSNRSHQPLNSVSAHCWCSLEGCHWVSPNPKVSGGWWSHRIDMDCS